jgi:serine/threonine protein kinase
VATERRSEAFGPLLAGVPETLGRYKLLATVDAGKEDLLAVHLALDEAPRLGSAQRLVALRCPRRDVSPAEGARFVRTFLDEARLTAKLDHPALCRVLEVGEAAGQAFVATEYVLGERLDVVIDALGRAATLPDGRRRWSYAAKIVADVSEGIHAAHELRGDADWSLSIAHRELAPQKVLVSYEGAVKVIDLGLAIAREALKRPPPLPLERLRFQSPEQVDPAGGELDRRTDVWSSGVLLWELITGRPLFSARDAAGLTKAIREAPIAPPSELIDKIPPRLDAIITRALARDPSRRYPTCRALSRDLEALVGWAGRPLSSAEVGQLMEALFPGRAESTRASLLELQGLRPESSREPGPATASQRPPPPEGDDDWDLLPTVQRPAPSLSQGRSSADSARPSPTAPPPRERAEPELPLSSLTSPPIAASYGEQVPSLEEDAPVRPLPPSRKRRRGLGKSLLVVLAIASIGVGVGLLISQFLGPPPQTTAALQADATAALQADATAALQADASLAIKGQADADRAPAKTADADLSVETEADIAPTVDAGADALDARADAADADVEADEERPTAKTRTPRRRHRRPHRTPPQPEEATSDEPGMVSVVTPGGWADIYLRGVRVGRSPTRFEAPSGRHQLRLLPFGREPAKLVSVNVSPGSSSRISVRLEREEEP